MESKFELKIRSDKAAYPYITMLFGLLFLFAGLYLLSAISIGIVKMLNTRIFDDWQILVAGTCLTALAFFGPAIILFRLIPKGFMVEGGSTFLIYPFGITIKVKNHRGFVVYKARYSLDDEMAVVWSPFFDIFVIGSLFYGNKSKFLKFSTKGTDASD